MKKTDQSLLRERIRFALKTYDYPIIKLCNGDDNQRSKISQQLNNNISVTLPTIELMLSTFDNLDANWLLRGEGSMERSASAAPRIYTQGGAANVINGNGNSVGASTTATDGSTIEAPTENKHYDQESLIRVLADLGINVREPRSLIGLQSIFDAKDESIVSRDRQIELLKEQVEQLKSSNDTYISIIKSEMLKHANFVIQK